MCSLLYQETFQTCVDCGPLFAYTHRLHPCVSNVWFMVPCLCASICLRPPLIKHVWIWAPCCVQASVSTRVSNTFCGSWSVFILSLHPFVSNTFDFGFLFVYPPAHTKMRATREDFTTGQRSESTVNLLGERATIWVDQVFHVPVECKVCGKWCLWCTLRG